MRNDGFLWTRLAEETSARQFAYAPRQCLKMHKALALFTTRKSSLTQNTWLITGCDKGMGDAVAEAILAYDDRVVVTARDAVNVAPLLAKYLKTAFGYALDITRVTDIQRVVNDAERITGGVDVLDTIAGGTQRQDGFEPVRRICKWAVQEVCDGDPAAAMAG